MIYEKTPPKIQVNDESQKGPVTYYRSDISPFPLRASGELKTVDGQSVHVDTLVDDKVLTSGELSSIEAINAKVRANWIKQQGMVAKP